MSAWTAPPHALTRPATSAIAWADDPASAHDSVSRILVLTALITAASSRAVSMVAAKRDRSITKSDVATCTSLAVTAADVMLSSCWFGGPPHRAPGGGD